MTDSPREARVLDAVVSLVDSLLDDFDVVDLLTELTERCADLLSVGAAGFVLVDPRGSPAAAARAVHADPGAGGTRAACRRGSLCGVLCQRPADLGGGSAHR